MTEINLLPRRRRLRKGMSARAWGYLLAGIALVSAIGVLVLIMSGPEKGPSVVEEAEPPEEVTVERKEEPIVETEERPRISMEVLDRIQEAIPPFVWLTSVTATSSGEVSVRGMAFSPDRIREFAQRLDAAEPPMVRKGSFEGRAVSEFSLSGKLPRRPVQATPPPFISPGARKQTIDAILRKGKPLDLKIVRGPEQIPMEPPSIRQRFYLRGEGSYDQLKAFMKYLAGLPEAIRVFRVVITAEAAVRAGTSTVGAIFTVDLYMRPE